MDLHPWSPHLSGGGAPPAEAWFLLLTTRGRPQQSPSVGEAVEAAVFVLPWASLSRGLEILNLQSNTFFH